MPYMKQEKVTFQTADFITIAGDWAAPEGAKNAALLLHMMPETRESFTPLSAELNKKGIATLAIDLRGHGESSRMEMPGKPVVILDYKKFIDKDHQASRLDVDAALNFLASKGFNESAIHLIGASIGANLALDAMSRYKGIARGVALSPGMDYRGVKTESAVRALSPRQKIWLIAADGDKYSADSVTALHQLQKETITLTIFAGSGHGTALFSSQKTLIPDIVKLLSS